MVDRFEVFREADKLRALRGREAVRVSVRRVRDKLLRRGSFGDVAPMVAEWRSARNYQPVIELMELPDALQRRLGEFGKALLDEVQAHESRIRDVERANLETERAAYRETLDEAAATVDVLDARVAALTAEVARLRASGATAPELDEDATRLGEAWERTAALRELMARRGEGVRTVGDQEAFWEAVELEAIRLLRRLGPLHASDLMLALPSTLKQRGSMVEMPLSVGWLRFRLRALTVAGGSLVERDGRFLTAEMARTPPAGFEPQVGGVEGRDPG